MESAINVSNLNISYKIHKGIAIRDLFDKKSLKKIDVVHAVKGISFRVKKGEVLGIIGKNGSGKSTLLRSLAGVFSPDNGDIELYENKVSLLSLGIGFKPELTGRENAILSGLLMGFSMKEVNERLPAIIDFAEIGAFIDSPVKTYSSGMYSKLAFSVAVSMETDILLIDEVLSVGDENFRIRSFNRIKEMICDQTRTVVIVSHSIDMLRSLCDRVMWLHEGQIKMLGDKNSVLDEYENFMQ